MDERERDSSCKISNVTIAGVEISFKEKDIKYLELLFVYYIDDPVRKEHNWELFNFFPPEGEVKHNQFESETTI